MSLRHAVPLLAMCICAMLAPEPARAHGGLVRSEPAAGARLTTPPSSIVLVFGERVDASGTLVELVDGAGRSVALGAPKRSPNGRRIRAAIVGLVGPGSYTIRWRIVGRDGHPVRGDIAFTVADPAIATSPAAPYVAPAAGAVAGSADTTIAPADRQASKSAAGMDRSADPAHAGHDANMGSSPTLRADTNPLTSAPPPDAAPEIFDASSPAYVLARWVTLLGMISAIGAVAYRGLVLPRAGLADHAAPAAATARVGLVAAGLLIAGSIARLVAQGTALDGVSAALSSLGDSSWGTAWLVQMAGALVALAGFAYATRGSAGWIAAGAGGLVAALGSALSGHAASSDRPVIAAAADTIHIIGGSGWLGTLGALFITTLMRARAAVAEDRERAIASLVTAFSPLALGFAGLAAASGVILALLQLTAIGDLFTTSWGRILLLKLALVATTAAIGAWNWRRVRPRLGTEGAGEQLRRSARAELVTGAMVVLATAVLVGMPTPH